MRESNSRSLAYKASALTTWPKRQTWRIRVSIPVPPRCKRGTLPIELIPHDYEGIETQADQPTVGTTKSNPGRTRTCNLKIRSLTRYPLRHRAHGSCGIRTHAYKCRLELESSALDHSAKKPSVKISDAYEIRTRAGRAHSLSRRAP